MGVNSIKNSDMRYFILCLLALIALPSLATVHADFTATRYNGCPPLLSTFTNTSTTNADTLLFRWDFANGNVSNQLNPSAIFNNTGTYRVRLIATNNWGESDTVTKSVVVFRVPQSNFTAATTTICLGDTLFLNGNVTLGDAPITDYAWGFGNGVASSVSNPFYVYTQTGLYDITLVIQDSNRCSISNTRTQYVNVIDKPVAGFTASPTQACAQSMLVNFTNTSVGSNLSYQWQLTNTVTATTANASHTYSNEDYLVKLTVSSPNGCTSTASQRVTIGLLHADFSASQTDVCTGQQVSFNNLSNFSGVSQWTFGDGGTSVGANPSHVYSQPGLYTVTLTQNALGCTDYVEKVAYINVRQGVVPTFTNSTPPTQCGTSPEVDFTSSVNGGSNLQYYWTFGDGGASSTDPNPSHVFSGNGFFTVQLTVTDANGCIAKANQTVAISNYVPVPNFSVTGLACQGGTLSFNNNTAQGYNLYALGYRFLWQFGDGDTSTSAVPSHAYQHPGSYTVSLTVISPNGCDSTVVKPNFITIDTMVVDFSVNQTFSPCPPFVTLFSSNINRTDVTYEWLFGDGQTDTAQNPTHIYFYPGIYTVSLKASTNNGCNNTAVYPNLIEVQGPYGVFTASPTEGCLPLTVDVNASVSANTSNMWCDLGDGSLISDSLQFGYTYNTVGVFHPKFILVDHVGCTVPYDLPVITTHSPATLNVKDTAICAGSSVSVNLGNDGSYHWAASADIACDTCAVLTIVPAATSTYSVTATNQYCSISDTLQIVVDTIPVLTSSTVTACVNSQVNLFAGNAHRIAWAPAAYLSDSASANPTCTAVDSVQYQVTAYNSLGCSVTTQVNVDVIYKLELNALADVTACAADSFSLSAVLASKPDAPVTYMWSPAGYLDSAASASPVVNNLTQSATFQVIVGSHNCQGDTATVRVNVNPLPQIQTIPSLTTSPHAEVKLWASSMSDLTYNWVAKDEVKCPGCRITTINPAETQMVYVTGIDNNGCKVSDSLQIRVMACDPESIFMPNVFTPNGDGVNDQVAVTSKVVTSLDYFRVFDEWGRLVYETKNINDGWDGKVNGQPASIDVFVYVLKGKCQNGEDVTKQGDITIVK